MGYQCTSNLTQGFNDVLKGGIALLGAFQNLIFITVAFHAVDFQQLRLDRRALFKGQLDCILQSNSKAPVGIQHIVESPL